MSSFDDRPEPVTRIIEVMATFPADWAFAAAGRRCVAGGQTRAHLDIDLVVFQEEQHAVFEYFDGWQLLGHDDKSPALPRSSRDGRRLDLPSHIHARGDGFDLDIQIDEAPRIEWSRAASHASHCR